MSSTLNPDWVNKIKSFKDNTTEEEKNNIINIINQFERDEIFNHNYNEKDIFHHIYKEDSQAKRQPNPFMIFRIVLGLIANHNKTKIGDGTFQSKIAGHMWGGATPGEKNKFADIGAKFKDLHKVKFPGYEYKPRARPQVTGFAENMTSRHFEVSNRQPIPQETPVHQLLLQAETTKEQIHPVDWDISDFSLLDQTIMLNGSFPLMQNQLQPICYPNHFSNMDQILASQIASFNAMNTEKVDYSLQQQQPTPSIALNCLDQSSFDPNPPNYAFNFNHPYNF